MTVEWVARQVEGYVVGQLHRQVLLRHRNYAAYLAMDDRDRATPVALAGNTPVTQAEIDFTLALRCICQHLLRQLVSDDLEGFFRRLAVEEARIDHHAVIDIGGFADFERCGIAVDRHDDRDDRKIIFAGEIQVALVTRRAAEDGARAVFHQHEVRDIDRQFPGRIERMFHADAGVDSLLLGRFQCCERRTLTAAFFSKGFDSRILCGGCLG
ncbi:hypothetical protein D3C73_562430 [compost metagenome]